MEIIPPKLFTNLTYKYKKNIPFTETTNNITSSPALLQGNKFKKYQNKIVKGLVNNINKSNSKEGFTNLSLNNNLVNKNDTNQFTSKNLFKDTNKVIQDTDFTLQNDRITSLKQEYSNTLNQYNSLLNQINGKTNNYFERVNSSNPYLGKNIFSTVSPNPLGYVTMQGVFKWYPDWNIVNSTAGLNGCPGISEETLKSALSVNVPIDYNNPGAVIQTNPPLIVGTPMVAGQSCGNEGANVYINSLINTNSSIS